MWPVKILDASVSGLGVVHGGELKPGDASYIDFIFDGKRIVLAVTVLHSRPMSGNYLLPRSKTIEPPPGYAGTIRFRSGLSIREGDTRVLQEYRRIVLMHLDKLMTTEAQMAPLLPDIDAD